MNRIARRAATMWLLIGLLLGGLGFFLYEYATKADNWVMHSGNPHMYAGGAQSIACGTVVDREGVPLLALGNGRGYAADSYVRASLVHWLGDRSGNIDAPVLRQYAEELAGFTPVNGIYGYGGTGTTARLTLSSKVQKAALEAIGELKGTVAVYNYKTGEILCAVSTPTFDPDYVPDFSADQDGLYEGVYLNRFTQASYIPGSIFKIVTTAAALEKLPDVQNDTFACTGTYSIGADRVTCERPHGTVNLRTAMENSCNCYYARLALQLGADVLQKAAERYNVTSPVTFDGVRTVSGNFEATGQEKVELAWAAIGQHRDQINPCAFLTFVGAIAAGGQGVKPHIMAQVGNYTVASVVQERIMPREIAKQMKVLMRNNVKSNYGDEHFHGLQVCAKSGTGQVDGGQRPNATFAGFVADEAYPLAFIVMMENAGYGKQICVPILSEVLAACMEVL